MILTDEQREEIAEIIYRELGDMVNRDYLIDALAPLIASMVAGAAEDGLRPWCCPEPRCAPLHLLAEAVAPGESFVCFGKTPEIEFTYDGVSHANDLRSCHYTPLKGLIAYQENRGDWEAMRAGYWRALAALDARAIPTNNTEEPADE